MKHFLTLSFAVASLINVGAAQSVISSSFALGARAGLGTLDDVVNVYSDAQGATLNSFDGEVSALASRESDFAFAEASGRAVFANAGAGTVSFDTGWTSVASVEGRTAINRAADLSVHLFTYTFEVFSPSVLQVDFDILGSGDTFGFQEWNLAVDGDLNAVEFGGDVFDPTATGSFQVQLSGGQHTFSFWNYGNVFSTPTNWAGRMMGSFDWSINAVPEPASLAVVTLGLIPLVRRRLRRL